MDTIGNPSERTSHLALSATEQAIATIWASELSVEAVAADSDFFALGGDSLKMLTVLFRIGQTLGVDVTPETLYVHTTLKEFSSAVEGMLEGADAVRQVETGTI